MGDDQKVMRGAHVEVREKSNGEIRSNISSGHCRTQSIKNKNSNKEK
jgi:hypothetical protein